jgi:Xaa-Pro dipeptidase
MVRRSRNSRRLAELCSRMADAGMDGALLLHPRDIFYYAGSVRPSALLVSRSSGKAVLFVRRGFEWAKREATVSRVEPMKRITDIAQVVGELGLVGGVLGTELDLVPVQLYRRLIEVFSDWSFADITPLVLAQRMVKDEKEIAVTRHAAAVADAGHRILCGAIISGVSELALAAKVEAAMRQAGHEAFQSLRYPEARGGGVLLMSGENLTVRGGHGLVVTGGGLSAAMPYGPSQRSIKPGDLVVLDIGSTYAGYTADESRTFVVGSATESQQALWAVALAAEEAVFEVLRPGVPVGELCSVAEDIVAQGALPHFGPGSLSLPGFVGHGVGLEIDEPPVLWERDETELRAGMVLAVEIEVSVRDAEMMAKVEDTVVIRPDGYELLTKTPRELIRCD